MLAESSSRQLFSQLCHIYVRTLQRLMERPMSSLYLVLLAEQLAEARELCSLLSTFLRSITFFASFDGEIRTLRKPEAVLIDL